MENIKPNPLLRWLPSLTDMAFLMPILFMFVRLDGARYILGDGDTGWHIRAGEWILQNGRVPERDLFSFTKAGERWYAWEWLWDAAFAWLHQQWGMAAVALASIFLICLTSVLLYRLVRRKCGDVIVAIAVTFLALAGASIHWLARPHLFTLLFVVIFCSVLERVREGRLRLLVLLPLLTALWANLHAGFFVGIVLIAAYAGGELATWLFEADPQQRRAALGRSKPYLLCAASCALASLVNPYTYHLHVHMVRFLGNSWAFRNIMEYLSFSFQHPAARYFEIMLAFGTFAAAWHAYHKRFTDALLLLGWAHLALISVRNVPIYMLVAAPIVAQGLKEGLAKLSEANLAHWLRRAAGGLRGFSAEVGTFDRAGRIPITSLMAAAALAALFYLPTRSSRFQANYDPKRYPAGAVEVLRRPEFSRNVFSNDEWGDYLIYRLYPQVRVFVDGRFDFYGPKFSEQYAEVMAGKHTWEETLERYQVKTIVLPVDASLAATLKQSRRWRIAYDDGVAIVFHKPAERLQASAAMTAEYPVIARSRISTEVIHGSQQSTRGE